MVGRSVGKGLGLIHVEGKVSYHPSSLTPFLPTKLEPVGWNWRVTEVERVTFSPHYYHGWKIPLKLLTCD